MGIIKIINVLREDGFERVFDDFKKADADEVIFIFPKNSRLAEHDGYFAVLAAEASRLEKTVSVMTADERIKGYVEKYGFKILTSTKPLADEGAADAKNERPRSFEVSRQSEGGIAEDFPETENLPEDNLDKNKNGDNESEDNQDLEENREEQAEEESVEELMAEGTAAQLAMAKSQIKSMSDIRHPDSFSPLKIRKIPESLSAVEIKKTEVGKAKKLENIWFRGKKENAGAEKGSIWKGLKSASKKSGHFKKIKPKLKLWLLGAGVAVLALVLYFTLGSAQVILNPQKQDLNFQLNVSVSPEFSETDAALNRIPGQLIEKEAKILKDFVSSGQREVAQKARGEITVYNNYNSDPQTFVATTRFESPEGLIFRTPRAITIPGARLANGQTVPGAVTVQVLADKPGEQYNLGPVKFTIPGLRGSPKFEGFYAGSKQAMSGGLVGWAKVITEKDFNDAKNTTLEGAKQKSLAAVKEAAGPLKVLEPIKTSIINLKSTGEIDDASEGFAVAAEVRAQTIVFDENDVLKLVQSFINKERAMVLLKNQTALEYGEAQFDFEKKLLTFKITVRGQAAAKIDEEKIITDMLGMENEKIKGYFLGIKEIESARVTLSPFWVKDVPKNRKNVKLTVVY